MRFLLVGLLAACALAGCAPSAVKIESPDRRWLAVVKTDAPLTIELRDGKGRLLVSQQIGMQLENGAVPAAHATVSGVVTRKVDEKIEPPVRQIAAVLQDRYQEATISFSDGTVLVLRLYNEGMAYRFRTALPGEITVVAETRICRFEGDPTIYYGKETDFFSQNQLLFEPRKLSELKVGDLTSLPLTIRLADSAGLLVLSESALENYPGQWLRVGKDSLDALNPGYPAKIERRSDRDEFVLSREPYIAKASGTRAFPWRTVAAAAQDAELLGNALNFLVADPPRIADASWIHPGKVQWDWWHDWTSDGKKRPISNETYKGYIDFAAKHGVPCIMLDEGWYKRDDLTQQAPGIDVPALVEYGRAKNVGLILWTSAPTLRKQFDEMMPVFEQWGVKGLKVDFFKRDDQPQVEFYWKIAEEAAKRKLVLNFHGCHKPAGLQRTYPNVLTFEAVRGLEQSKNSRGITPTHDLNLPFTRMMAGPMDYTPGAMRNAQPAKFQPNKSSPMSQGTRSRELAKYVIYDSPMQMLSDAPSHYDREPEIMEFLGPVPSTWDETRPLSGKIGEYAAVARRSGDAWFLGAMTNEQPREMAIDLNMLGEGEYDLTIWQDGPGAGENAMDFEQRKIRVRRGDKVPARLAASGGWVAIAQPVKSP
jgi:alpha-glucosidase